MSTFQKIVRDPTILASILDAQRRQDLRIVLTNGTFDILHVGHIRALEEARRAGDVLLVALNTDDSVRSYKGPGRPLIPEEERAEVLAALECVDFVTFFEESTAHDLLRRVQPDIYAKGRDYGVESLPEAETAREVGAEIVFVGDEKTHAVSDIIERIRRSVGEG